MRIFLRGVFLKTSCCRPLRQEERKSLVAMYSSSSIGGGIQRNLKFAVIALGTVSFFVAGAEYQFG